MSEPPPLALYVHLPWCIRKCPYCDFNSHERSGALPEQAYVRALLADLAHDLPLVAGRTLISMFIGGGTPSLFSGGAIEALLEGVRAHLEFAPDAEITLEANPGAIDVESFAAYRAAGVNRLSLGVQSFRAAQLQSLGRVHGADEALRALALARAAGFSNVNLDLMHGLPGDAPGDAVRELETAIALGPEHISWYQLTLEPGTAFARMPPRLPAHDQIVDDFEAGIALLARHGYGRYEISAFALTDRESQHNLNYWEFGDYLGLGAGAHGKITTGAGRVRTTKRIHPTTYLKAAGTSAAVTVEPRADCDLVIEFMLNALRLTRGFSRTMFCARTGLPVAALTPGVSHAIARGWLTDDGERLAPTALGFRFLNDLQLLFLD